MKIQFQILLLLHILLPILNAQLTSQFPIKPGSVWRINYEYSCMDVDFSHVNEDEEYKYFIDGDTVIGARTYYKIYKTGLLFLESPFFIGHKYVGSIRDSANRYFFVDKENGKEELIYDFSVGVGEMIYIKEYGMNYPVDFIDTLEDGRKRFIFNIINVNCGSANTIIEGIGWLGGLLEGNSCSGHPGVRGSYLVCYSENGETIYETDHTRCGEKVICNYDILSINHRKESLKPDVIILPGGLLKVSLADYPGGFYDIEIFDILGITRFRQNSELNAPIDPGNIGSGTYLLRISTGNQFYSAMFVMN